jgi:gliding motility-associated-like protein
MNGDRLIFSWTARHWLFLSFIFLVSHAGFSQCLWYPDNDNDGFGAQVPGTSGPCGIVPPGMVSNHQDCNDLVANARTWAAVGGASTGSGNVVNVKLRIAPDGTPYVLYQSYIDPDPRVLMTVRKYDGTSWVPVGGEPIGVSEFMLSADLAIDAAGVPYISFADQDQGFRVSVIKYNAVGNTWDVVGSRGFSAHDVATNAPVGIAIDNSNIPYIFYANAAGYDGFVMRYDPVLTSWQNVGVGPVASALGSGEYGIAISSSGIPHVVFTESNTEISVMRFTGGSWQVVGARSFSDNLAFSPQLALDADNVPYVAYLDDDGMGSLPNLTVQRYNAGTGAWANVGTPVYNDYTELSLAVDRLGVPYIAYTPNGNITVARWNGTAWQTVENDDFASGLSPSLAIAPDNVPHVGYKALSASDDAWVSLVAPVIVGPDKPILSSTKTSICSGESTPLTVASTVSLHHAAAWTWYAAGCGTGTALGTGATLNVSPTATTTYYARGEGGCVLTGLCEPITITVTTSPTAPTLSATKTAVCPGGSTTLSIATGTLGQPATQQWAWYATTCGDAAQRLGTGTSIAVTPSATTTYYARGEGSCQGSCAPVAIQVEDLPVANGPVATAASICSGSAGTLTVTPVSNVASYQWRVSDGASWTDIAGQTTATLSRAAADLQLYPAENIYSVLLKNSIGCEQTLFSNLKILSFQQPAIAGNGNPIPATVCSGSNASFSVAMSSGTQLEYQWQVDDGSGFVNVSDGGVYSGATTATLHITGAAVSLNGRAYRVAIGNAGCSAITSDGQATLRVTDAAVAIIQQPADASVCAGGDTSFGVVASGTDLGYQWQESSGAAFTDLTDNGAYTGTTTALLTLAGTTASLDGRMYRVLVSNTTCGTSAVSDGLATLAIATSGVSITGDPSDATICQGERVAFQVSAEGSRLMYQWQVSADGISFEDIADDGDYAGTSTHTLEILAAARMDNYYYRVMVSNGGCESVASGQALLRVSTEPGAEGCPYVLLVSEGLSPNGDSILDYWVIEGIERYPGNRVKVYNVWGDLVFEQNAYANEVQAWRGESNRGATLTGSRVPDGTYYYTIDLGDNQGKDSILKGFVVLKR